MAPFRYSAAVGAFVFSVSMSAPNAVAITAKDVMEKMAEKERFGYVTGLVDMLSYQVLLSGNQARAKCIADAFYGKQNDAWRLMFETFGKYPDKAPEGLVVVIMNRACGS